MINISTVRSRRRTFVDTAGWYSLSWEQDVQHDLCTSYYLDLVGDGAQIFTSDFVLDETISRLRYDFSHAGALAFADSMSRAAEAGTIQILRVDERIWRAAINIFRIYDDQDFSFTDCRSFVLARELEVDEVFTFDRHFLTMGFVIRPV